MCQVFPRMNARSRSVFVAALAKLEIGTIQISRITINWAVSLISIKYRAKRKIGYVKLLIRLLIANKVHETENDFCNS